MGRIVVNKHFDVKSQITPDKFVNKGELIISNQVGYEGIFISNKNGDVLFIGPTSGSSADVPVEYKEYIETFVNNSLVDYLTSGETIALIKASANSESISEEIITEIVSGQVQSALVVYFTSAQTQEYVANILKNYPTNESVKDLVSLEVAKIVDSADTSFDTLREIAEWITNDTEGAAAMANDVKKLKEVSANTRISAIESLSADTRLTNLEISSHTHNNIDVINSITEDKITEWDLSEENAKSFASAYTDSALTQYATKTYVNDAIKSVSGSSNSSNFIFLTIEEYDTLIKDGSVEVNGQLIVYDENAFYALYEPEE